VPAVRRGGDAAVEVGADGAGHALQRLRGPAQGGRGTAGAGAAPPHAGDREDARPTTAPGQPGLGVVARQPDLGARVSSRCLPGEEEASEAGETSAASEDGTRAGASASASRVPRQEEEEEEKGGGFGGFVEEAVAAPEVGEAVSALRVVVDAAVAGGAAGPQHAVQRVRRAVQAGAAAAGVPADSEPHLRAVGARQQAQPGAAAPPASEEPEPEPEPPPAAPSARGASPSASHGRAPVSTPAVAREGGVPADAGPPASEPRRRRWGSDGRRGGRC